MFLNKKKIYLKIFIKEYIEFALITLNFKTRFNISVLKQKTNVLVL